MRTFEELKNDEEFWDAIFYSTRGARHYDKVGTEETTCNYSICAECGGRCCKRCGCHLSPDDFKDLSFSIIPEIAQNEFAVELNLETPSGSLKEPTLYEYSSPQP